ACLILTCGTSLCFIFACYADHRDLPSFPTRRSSDLAGHDVAEREVVLAGALLGDLVHLGLGVVDDVVDLAVAGVAHLGDVRADRSEEHTSELQSRENLVCRLLLEKKNRSQLGSKTKY